MERKEETCQAPVEPEHLVESHAAMPAHAAHGDSLKEAVDHDKAVEDDRWVCLACCVLIMSCIAAAESNEGATNSRQRITDSQQLSVTRCQPVV